MPTTPRSSRSSPRTTPSATTRCDPRVASSRSEEHTSELQSRSDLVCRLLLEKKKIDKIAELRTSIVTISGGEAMMHPQLDDIIRHIRSHGIIAGLISNGYYFTPDRIKRLTKAGLDSLQISIDNVEPDEVSRKSLRVLDKKLRFLAEHADFHININSVIGGGIKQPEDALTVAERAVEIGFSTPMGGILVGAGTL